MLLTVAQRHEQLFEVFGAPPLVLWLSLRALAAAVNTADLKVPLSAKFPSAKVLRESRSVSLERVKECCIISREPLCIPWNLPGTDSLILRFLQ
jgi:hypothetical protein